MKKILSFLFSFALAIGLMPGLAFGANSNSGITSSDGLNADDGAASGNAAQIVDQGGPNPKDGSWHTGQGGGLVRVSKTIEPTGIENYFDITLTVDAKEKVADTSTAVVIVMDASNTMNSNSRLDGAKAAANQFIEQFCKGEGLGPDRRIGVVTFNTNAQWANGLTLQKVDASDVNTLKNRVNAITTPSAVSHDRFTNMEAGLQLAYNVLDKEDVAFKYVIFLTDGFPTTYINRTSSSNVNSTSSIAGWDPYETESYSASKANKDGYFCDTVLKVTCKEGTSYSDKAAVRTRQIAATMKNDGVNIFSVGIDIGGQTIKTYVDAATGSYSIVDRRGTTYEIGSASNTKAYAAWLGNSVAGGPNLTEQTHRYADGDNSSELKTAFNNILADIKDISGIHLTDADVVDPMGDTVEFVKLIEAQGDKIAYKQGTDSLEWDLIESNAEIIDVASDGARTVRYKASYRVRLENEAASYVSESTAMTNDDAVLHFQTIGQTDNEPLEFPDPSVKGYKGAFGFTKVDSTDSTPVAGSTFELKHSEGCSVCEAAGNKVAIDSTYAESGENGVVSFEGIPSGHDYVLLETSAALGFQLSKTEYAVSVSYGNVVIKDAQGATVFDGSSASNNFTVANNPLLPCEVDFVVSKVLNYGDKDGNAVTTQNLTPEDGEHSFELSELAIANGHLTKVKTVETITNQGTAAEFETIHFETPGTYYFMISEVSDADADVKYDNSYYIARVTVSGDQADHEHGTHLTSVEDLWRFDGNVDFKTLSDSSLGENAKLTDKHLTFTNVKSASVSVDLPAISKNLDGTPVTNDDAYAFQLVQQLKDSEGKVLQTVTLTDGKAEFEALTFDKAGTYKYTISELVGSNGSIYYDEGVYDVEIVVSAPDPHSGKPYAATISVTDPNGNSSSAESAHFNNVTKKASLTFYATKIVDADKMPEANEYEFALHKVDENWENPELVSEGVNNANGLVSFNNGTVEFTAPGAYHFLISEIQGTDPTILFDSTIHKVTVVVSDEGNQPFYTIKAFDDGAKVITNEPPSQANLFPQIDFSNIIGAHYMSADNEGTYASGAVFLHFANSTRQADVIIEGDKTLDGKTPAEGAFSFALKDANGNVIETVKNDAEGHFRFGSLKLSYDKVNAENNEHIYFVSEVDGNDSGVIYDKSIYKVTVTVMDPSNTDPTTPIPSAIKYEKMLNNDNMQAVDKMSFANETDSALPDTGEDPVLPETGDSTKPALLLGTALSCLALMALALRKLKQAR